MANIKSAKKRILVAETRAARNKAVIIIKGNFGVALANPPQIIPHHNVWQRLSELAEKNGGRFPKILRRNQIIEIPSGRYKGIWRITSIKNNSNYIGVDMIHPIYARIKEKSKINVNLNTIIKDGMKIIDNTVKHYYNMDMPHYIFCVENI